MSVLERIDSVAKGLKTYLTSGVGVLLVAYLQSKGVDAVGLIDTLSATLQDTVTQVVALWGVLIAAFRKAMPDKRG